MKNLIEIIVKPLVDNPESVEITESITETEARYQIIVHPDDVGKVIGKQGRVAKAIRTVVYAVGRKESKRIYLDIN